MFVLSAIYTCTSVECRDVGKEPEKRPRTSMVHNSLMSVKYAVLLGVRENIDEINKNESGVVCHSEGFKKKKNYKYMFLTYMF